MYQPAMYSIEDIHRGIENPYLVLRKLNRLYHSRFGYHQENPNGIDIFEEDWDNLLILDACRSDVLADRWEESNSYSTKTSSGSTSVEFIEANFSGKTLDDTIIISANGYYELLREDIGLEVFKLEYLDEEYQGERTGVVPAQRVTEVTEQLQSEYPNKRLIVHYLQPHTPYIGSTGAKYFDYDSKNLWEKFRDDKYGASNEMLWKSYCENVDHALEHIKPLLDDLHGKTVITADHGEMLGDRSFPIPIQEYAHIPETYVSELVEVPWITITNGSRKRIIPDNPKDHGDIDTEKIKQNLRNLGYRE